MPLSVCIYEDDTVANFYPLTYFRPVAAMRAGILPLCMRARRHFPGAAISLGTRASVARLTGMAFPDFPVNLVKRGEEDDLLFINGRTRAFGDLAEQVSGALTSTKFTTTDGETVAVLLRPSELSKRLTIAEPALFAERFTELEDASAIPVTTTLYRYPWELVDDIDSEIASDFEYLRASFTQREQATIRDGVHLINDRDIFIEESADILPGTVIDARSGPVYIGANVTVDSQVAIYGPSAISANCRILAGKISGSSFGHTCRVGGEVEASVFQSYVNKYHEGFIGHSYVGSWVNFGAMTTNSDLKNNYSTIRVTVNGEAVDTESIKVGSFVGDHSKTGIGTLLNTGIVIGAVCNLFGGGLISDKSVADFSWGQTGSYVSYDLERAVDTVRRTMARRDVELTEDEERILRALAESRVEDSGVLRF